MLYLTNDYFFFIIEESLFSLLQTIQDVSPTLKPLHDELINLRRQLALLAQKSSGYTASDINELQEKVR